MGANPEKTKKDKKDKKKKKKKGGFKFKGDEPKVIEASSAPAGQVGYWVPNTANSANTWPVCTTSMCVAHCVCALCVRIVCAHCVCALCVRLVSAHCVLCMCVCPRVCALYELCV